MEITAPAQDEFNDVKKSSFPWHQRSSFKVFPSSEFVERSTSNPSSHFCDLVINDQDDDDVEYLEETNDLEKQNPIPPTTSQKRSRLSIILLDQGLFTVYKQLFLVCFALNVIALALAATGHFAYGKNKATLFSIGNILASTLCRSEVSLRVIFWLAVNVLGRPWVPVKIRTAATSFLQCLGGIHSGCGISSIVWLVYSLVLTLKQNTSHEIIGVSFTILSLLCFSSLAAFPLVRHLHHNVFERTHRFAGWLAVGLLWVFVFLTISFDPASKSYKLLQGSSIIRHQEFWFTLTVTLIIIIPWITVRKVPVTITAPSSHAALIKFEGGVKAGLLGRISPSPLSEWHAFGIISDGKKQHMMLAGAVGDFTRSLVSNPPRQLWVRQVHFAGLPYLVNMYERVLLVATGSGVCVFLSFLLQPCSADVCLLWVAKGIEQNFGNEIKDMVSGLPEGKVIVHDTEILGRPDMSDMSVNTAKKWKAQVVIVTSNPEGSRDVVNACKGAGIPAFGPIWDS